VRAWARAARSAAIAVADRPSLWIPGGLAWLLTVGWLALFVGVARPPSVGELTFLGADLITSGAWPWNLVAVLAVVIVMAVGAAALVAVAEVTLLDWTRGMRVDPRGAFALTIVCWLPVALAAAMLAFGVAAIAVIEFNSPADVGGPVLRIVLRLLPLIGLAFVVAVASAALQAAALRRLAGAGSTIGALRSAPRALKRSGGAATLHVLASTLVRLGYLVLAAVLLRVLWAPIEQRLALDGIDAAAALLLVGFVAIWLCLVLGGGALHAWGSVAWTRILEPAAEDRGTASPTVETTAQP
jgi:hypothetical protein